uniref:FMN-binding protein n=1 Tax=Lachnospira eligens TaxID=39485 RepID=UPI00402A4698
NSGELSGGSGSDAPANTTFKADGTYTGSAVCETYNYNVMVTIVISGDTITSVTAESEAGAQDVQYFNMANAKVPAQLLANQSTSGVDAVSGATKSSNAIKKAFYYAYKSAKK